MSFITSSMEALNVAPHIKEEVTDHHFYPVKIEMSDSTIKQENSEGFENCKQFDIKKDETIDLKGEFSKGTIINLKLEDCYSSSTSSTLLSVTKANTRDLFDRCSLCKKAVRCECNRSKNKNAKRYKCVECKYITESKALLATHFKRRHDMEWRNSVTLCCYNCDYKTSFKGSLAEHIKRTHRRSYETFTCPKCPYKTKLKEYLSKHIQRQHDLLNSSNLFKCTQCNYTSKYNHHLLQHIEVKHNDSLRYECEICGWKFKCRQYVQKHMKRRHSGPVKCDYCTFVAYSEEYLREHKKNKHASVAKIDKIPRSKTYKCKHCQFMVDNHIQFQNHYKYEHREQYMLEEFGKNKKFTEILSCPHCEFKTKYPHDLRMHIKHQHDENCQMFECPYCKHRTKYKYQSLKHIRVKHGEEKVPSRGVVQFFHCMHCDFYTRYKDILVHHFVARKNTFSCDICSLKTGCPSYLDYHISLLNHSKRRKENVVEHTNKANTSHGKRKKTIARSEKKCSVCLHCGFEAVYKPTLVIHLQCSHKAKHAMGCNFCNFHTKCRSFLNYHVQTKHIKDEDIVQEENFVYQKIIKTEDDCVQTENVLINRNGDNIFDTIKNEVIDKNIDYRNLYNIVKNEKFENFNEYNVE